ncbi:MAG: hypothetical protein AAF628_16275 [Planctomycetota bacterium]
MSLVHWEVFEKLPGAADVNFEKLCRALVRRHYARYGEFAALAAQPGVEFHLKLHTECSLGDPGRWYGWQCRWYDLPGGRAIGTVRRNKIKKAIRTTEKVLPGVTDWVLWTRRPLTKGDQKWFRGLETSMELHLWTADEVEEHLSGPAEIFRGTYFGELVFTPDTLQEQHERAVAPIRPRWQPEVHQTIDAERALRRMLGESETWAQLTHVADRLQSTAKRIDADAKGVEGPLKDAVTDAAAIARSCACALKDALVLLQRVDLELLRDQLADCPAPPDLRLRTLPRQLRSARSPAALTVTNALSDIQLAIDLLRDVDESLGVRMVAVLSEAGCGKTQLAAQLTVSTVDRPAGVLLLGRDLSAGHSLDDLARRVVLQGKPVETAEALVAAVDAAAQRAHRRLPIVIDGLNEAEDPRDWRALLATLNEVLRQYSHVLVVCTARTAFADIALPDGLERVKVVDFERDTLDAVRKYFKFYRINPADAELPWELLAHPLTLRLFCEVTNPTRAREVGMEAMPTSLTALFDRYLEQCAERIASLSPRTHPYYVQDVRAALQRIGEALWEERARSLGWDAVKALLGDEARPWNESMVRALEEEGVLLRVPGETPNDTGVAVVYDALGGHLVADAALRNCGGSGVAGWLNDPATAAALAGSQSEQHPLATDVFNALVGLVPKHLHGRQMWKLVDEPMRTTALQRAADLEGACLDAETVAELRELVARAPTGARDLLIRLRHTRGAPGHPLSAEFLDAVLRPMQVAQRDLRWTEWVRLHHEHVLADLEGLERRWRRTPRRTTADRLRALWVMWTLTSTVRRLRDQATRALYWYGLGEPKALFDLALDALAVNDPYVSERALAASYGVAMAHQRPNGEFARSLGSFLGALRDAATGTSATYPTSHWLARLCCRGIVTLALKYHPAAVPEELKSEGILPLSPGPRVDPIEKDDPRAREVDRTIGMDFGNYTLGRLFDDRGNYDDSHAGHQAATAHVRGTVWALGWRAAELGAVDERVASYRGRMERAYTERYGKKYGWIGFHTYAGILEDEKRLPSDGRLSDIHIDPSFPEPPPPVPLTVPAWARPTPRDDRRWVRHGIVKVPDEMLCCPKIGEHPGPWIAVAGDFDTKRQTPGRRVFGLLTCLLVPARRARRLAELLGREQPGNRWLPEPPSDYYTFAGEIPWHPDFATSPDEDGDASLYRGAVEPERGAPIPVEILAHRYAWEGYHSEMNDAGGVLVPSRPFSESFDLRSAARPFDQLLPDGTMAALSFAAPEGFEGHVLYLREDLVRRYARRQRLIWFMWGERQLFPFRHDWPDWLVSARRSGADTWRVVRRGEELSRAFARRSRSS